MPTWLMPWLFPVALLIGVVGGVVTSTAGPSGFVIAWCLLVFGGGTFLIRRRLRYLKDNPPDPELSHRPFWRW